MTQYSERSQQLAFELREKALAKLPVSKREKWITLAAASEALKKEPTYDAPAGYLSGSDKRTEVAKPLRPGDVVKTLVFLDDDAVLNHDVVINGTEIRDVQGGRVLIVEGKHERVSIEESVRSTAGWVVAKGFVDETFPERFEPKAKAPKPAESTTGKSSRASKSPPGSTRSKS